MYFLIIPTIICAVPYVFGSVVIIIIIIIIITTAAILEISRGSLASYVSDNKFKIAQVTPRMIQQYTNQYQT